MVPINFEAIDRVVLVFDLYPQGASIRAVLPGLAARPWLGLHLPPQELQLPRRRPGAASTFQHGDSTRIVAETLESLAQDESGIVLEEAVLVLGVKSDPFVPFEGKFDAALRVLELLAAVKPYRLCLQTRSPLLVLALPVLKALGARARATIAFEAATDKAQERIGADLPRPSERLKALRVLTNFNITTAAQLMPIADEDYTELTTQIYEARAQLYVPPCEALSEQQARGWAAATSDLRSRIGLITGDRLLSCAEHAWLAEPGEHPEEARVA